MKIDDMKDALSTAKHLAENRANPRDVANALLRAHLEGVDQARSALAHGQSLESVSKELYRRRNFILSELKKQDAEV
jgi:hypothetical protein